MKKQFLVLIILMALFVGCSSNTKDTTVTSLELTPDEIESLNLALQDEFKAEATYQKVIDKFGEVKPFSNIINAEVKHSSRLIEIFETYNLKVPNNDWYDKVPEFNSVEEACQAGVQAEIDNAALYDKLFNSTDRSDILIVYEALQSASLNNHLPAFKRCS